MTPGMIGAPRQFHFTTIRPGLSGRALAPLVAVAQQIDQIAKRDVGYAAGRAAPLAVALEAQAIRPGGQAIEADLERHAAIPLRKPQSDRQPLPPRPSPNRRPARAASPSRWPDGGIC